jgi:hypothetical protein
MSRLMKKETGFVTRGLARSFAIDEALVTDLHQASKA